MHSSHAREYLHISGEIDSIYHELALKFGISDSVLNILYVVCIVPLQSGKNRVRGGDENER